MSNTRKGGSPGTSPAWASIPGSMRSTPQSPGGTGETSANAPVCARPGDFAMQDLSRAVILQLPDYPPDGPPGHGLTCRSEAGPSAGVTASAKDCPGCRKHTPCDPALHAVWLIVPRGCSLG